MNNYDYIVSETAKAKQFMSESGENWVPVSGYEDYYYVSDTGKVYSMPRFLIIGNSFSKRIGGLVGFVNSNNGYMRVSLRNSSITVSKKFVHVLVANAFIPNPEGKPQINHKNGKKRDNRVENLEWVTARENLVHSYKVLGRTPRSKHKKIK